MQRIRRWTLQSGAAISLISLTVILLASFISHVVMAQVKEPAPQSTPPVQYPTEIHLKFHRSAADTAAILSSIDGLLNFSSEHSGLPIRSHVQGHLIDRDEVRQKVEAGLRKEDLVVRLQRSYLVWKKLGLVPRDFDVGSFILSIQKDDTLAGFYDPATKDFYMLDWIPSKEQSPVMAHELTHALQDQYIGLENWIKTPSGTAKEPVDSGGRDEPAMARRAVGEGQAMAVMLDYVLAPYSKSVTDLPAIDASTMQQMMQRTTQPAFLRAPRYIRESQAFPHNYGLQFVYQVLKKEGKGRAFAGTLRNPPVNTRQVMHPALYLAGETTPAFSLPPLEPFVGSNFEVLDSGTVGEFDVMLYAEQFGLEEKAPQIAAQWRGGYYYAVQPKSTFTAQESASASPSPSIPPGKPMAGQGTDEHLGSIGLFYISRWATPAAATQFAHLYASSVLQRYSDATPKAIPSKPGQPAGTASAWSTPDGMVSVETHGTLVLVMESFDDPTASRLRALAIGREPSTKARVSATR